MDDRTPAADAPSKPPQRFRRTRIVVSVFFGVVTVAICLVWWWSYWRSYSISYTGNTTTAIRASNGAAYVIHLDRFHYNSVVPGRRSSGLMIQSQAAFYAHSDFSFTRFRGLTQLKIPIWFLTALSVAATILPLITAPLSLRFSLSDMLVVTTLLAVVLGLAVLATR